MTSPTQATWATTSDVTTLTGKTVNEAQLVQANAVVELHTRRVAEIAAARTGSRDKVWLRRAVAYQAAWMLAQPDMFERLDMTSLTSVEGGGQLREGALLLAPAARRALRNVSWLKTRSLHVRSPFQDGPGGLSPNPDSAVNDEFERWSPIGGG